MTARETDIGALINAGSGTGGGSGPELFRVADIHKMRIYVQVPQQLSAGIRPGLTADLHSAAISGQDLQGDGRHHLERDQHDRAHSCWSSCMPTIRTACCSPAPMPRSTFELPSNPNVVRIPTSALMFREQGLQVAVLGPGDKVELKPVTLGRNLGTDVEVLSGLTLSDRVINSPPDSLAAGDVVRVAAAGRCREHRRTADASGRGSQAGWRRSRSSIERRSRASRGRQP